MRLVTGRRPLLFRPSQSASMRVDALGILSPGVRLQLCWQARCELRVIGIFAARLVIIVVVPLRLDLLLGAGALIILIVVVAELRELRIACRRTARILPFRTIALKLLVRMPGEDLTAQAELGWESDYVLQLLLLA